MVTLAGPWMNLLLAIAIIGLARLGSTVHSGSVGEVCLDMARLSLLFCFFNLLPIPPLDGSQVVRSLIGMSHETYHQIARYGIFILILVLQIPGRPAGAGCRHHQLLAGHCRLVRHAAGDLTGSGAASRRGIVAFPGAMPCKVWVSPATPLVSHVWSLNQTSYENTLDRH